MHVGLFLSAGNQDFDFHVDRATWDFVALQLTPKLFADSVTHFGRE
jgi:hypothetical protein